MSTREPLASSTTARTATRGATSLPLSGKASPAKRDDRPELKTHRPPAAIVAAPPVRGPTVKAPDQAQAGREIRISGSGFKAASKVEIVLAPSTPETAVSATAGPDGTFRATVRLPSRSGRHKIQVIGTSASGHKAAVQKLVLVVASKPAAGDLARPVLLTLAVVIPLTTWLVLEFLGWRGRREGTWR